MTTIAQNITPGTIPWADLFAWVFTHAGLGLVTAACVWLLTAAYKGHFHHELPGVGKAALAFVGPFVVAAVVYLLYVVIGGAVFVAEDLAGALVLAGRMAVDGQAVYNGVQLIQKWWDMFKAKWEAKGAS